MTRQLNAQLIVAKAESGTDLRTERIRGKELCLAERRVMIDLIKTAVVGEKQHPFLGDQVVQLEFPDLDVHPAVAEQIIETDEYVFKMK